MGVRQEEGGVTDRETGRWNERRKGDWVQNLWYCLVAFLIDAIFVLTSCA